MPLLLFATGLYEQSVARALGQQFGSVEYLVVNAQTGGVVAVNWPDLQKPVRVGSLTKPFLAAELPADSQATCGRGQCWLPRGHGRLGLTDAIAMSCNQFFLQNAVLGENRLPGEPAADAATLMGLKGDWRVPPLSLAHAYLALIRDVNAIRPGLAAAAQRGTARSIRAHAFAKTGTAKCSHPGGGAGDGLVMAVWPTAAPQWLLMIRVHGTTGSVAAGRAAPILRVIDDAR